MNARTLCDICETSIDPRVKTVRLGGTGPLAHKTCYDDLDDGHRRLLDALHITRADLRRAMEALEPFNIPHVRAVMLGGEKTAPSVWFLHVTVKDCQTAAEVSVDLKAKYPAPAEGVEHGQ